MHTQKKMSLRSRINSFAYAFNGVVLLFRKEPNALIHLLAAVIVIMAGIFKGISPGQWALIAIAIGIVWITEAVNTAIESLSDLYCDNKFHPQVKIIKDVAAAAVLIAAMVSIAIGIVVFFF